MSTIESLRKIALPRINEVQTIVEAKLDERALPPSEIRSDLQEKQSTEKDHEERGLSSRFSTRYEEVIFLQSILSEHGISLEMHAPDQHRVLQTQQLKETSDFVPTGMRSEAQSIVHARIPDYVTSANQVVGLFGDTEWQLRKEAQRRQKEAEKGEKRMEELRENNTEDDDYFESRETAQHLSHRAAKIVKDHGLEWEVAYIIARKELGMPEIENDGRRLRNFIKNNPDTYRAIGDDLGKMSNRDFDNTELPVVTVSKSEAKRLEKKGYKRGRDFLVHD